MARFVGSDCASFRRYPAWLVPGSGEERRDAVAAARPHCYDPCRTMSLGHKRASDRCL